MWKEVFTFFQVLLDIIKPPRNGCTVAYAADITGKSILLQRSGSLSTE